MAFSPGRFRPGKTEFGLQPFQSLFCPFLLARFPASGSIARVLRRPALLLPALVLAGALFSACQSPHGRRPPPSPNGTLAASPTASEPSPTPQSQPLPTPPSPAPTPPTPAPIPQPAPAPVSASATNTPTRPLPADPWVPLQPWLAAQGSSPLHPLPRGREIILESDGLQGSLQVVPGRKEAAWNGTQFLLGFEPRRRNGDTLVHLLDLEAQLRPLVAHGAGIPDVPRTIVVDPGHGGINAGTRSIAGNRFEKDFTLDWARRLKPLLEKRGWTVLLTRTNDIDLSLAERVDLSEASGASLFLSLHFNSAFPNPQPAGVEVYCLTPAGMNSHVVREYADDPSRAYPNNAFDPENVRMALAIQRSLVQRLKLADRGVRRARFLDVLRWQNRPAVLIEGGYLSNPSEASRIQTPEWRQKLAEAVAEAFP